MPVRVNFKEGGDSQFEVMPIGIYYAIVFNVEEKESQSSGQPYLNFEFKIVGGEYDGRKVWMVASLQPHVLWRLKKVLEAFNGGEPIETEEDGSFEFEIEDLFGKECRLKIGQHKYEGQLRNDVKDVLEMKGEAPAPVEKKKSESSASGGSGGSASSGGEQKTEKKGLFRK